MSDTNRIKPGDIIIFKTKVKERYGEILYETIREIKEDYEKNASEDPYLELMDIEVIQS